MRILTDAPYRYLGVLWVISSFHLAAAKAQEGELKPKEEPHFGTAALKDGFQPDPFKKQLVAGGAAQRKIGNVTSWLEATPSFVLDYTAGKMPLTFFVDSTADTTLVICLPDGTWLADDDSGGNLNPLIKIDNPPSGRYAIWTGTYAKNVAFSTLYIGAVPKKIAPPPPERKVFTEVSLEKLDTLMHEWRIEHKHDDRVLRWNIGDDTAIMSTLLRDKVILITTTLQGPATIEQINKWNDERVLSRAVLKDGRARLEADLNCSIGVTDSGIRAFVDEFGESLRAFRAFLKNGTKPMP